MNTTRNPPVKVTRIVVAVHGIGDQVRNATAQNVARIFGAISIPLGRFPEQIEHKVEGPNDSLPPASEPDPMLWRTGGKRWRESWRDAGTAFAEVFWADIPRDVADDGYTIQETKSWGITVVERLRARDRRAIPEAGMIGRWVGFCKKKLPRMADAGGYEGSLPEVDYDKAAAALAEFVDGVRLIETIGRFGGTVGLPTFDAGAVLNNYVNDVQVVAEYRDRRERIVHRFIRTLRKVAAAHPEAEVHIVAHSEGTVVAVLGLLHAFCGTPLYERSCQSKDGFEPERAWLSRVRGFMTIGSPIDKHVVMWPELWKDDEIPNLAEKSFKLETPIPWFNYYDSGDPVGFELETARGLFLMKGWANSSNPANISLFHFPEQHDHGFTRYPLPGKAHNDYFTDEDVFAHYSDSIHPPVRDGTVNNNPAPAPATRWMAMLLSRVCPYLLTLAILGCGVWVVHKAVLTFVLASSGINQVPAYSTDGLRELVIADLEFALRTNQPVKPPIDEANTWRNVLGITLLIAGVTLVTRLARLTRGRRYLFGGWHGMGLFLFALSAIAFHFLVTGKVGEQLGLKEWIGQGIVGWLRPYAGAPLIRPVAIAVVAVVALGAALLHRVPELKRRGLRLHASIAASLFVAWLVGLGWLPRNDFSQYGAVLGAVGLVTVSWVMAYSMPRSGIIPLLYAGGALTLLSILGCLAGLSQSSGGQNSNASLWPVIAGALGFLYLWWLATILFDLTFIWHRYIVGNEAHAQLDRIFVAEQQAQAQGNPD